MMAPTGPRLITPEAALNIHWKDGPRSTDYLFHNWQKLSSLTVEQHTEFLRRMLLEKITRKTERDFGSSVTVLNRHGNLKAYPSAAHQKYPTAYQWHFSQEYPCFPTLSFSRWDLELVVQCNEALDREFFTLVQVDMPSATGHSDDRILRDVATERLEAMVEASRRAGPRDSELDCLHESCETRELSGTRSESLSDDLCGTLPAAPQKTQKHKDVESLTKEAFVKHIMEKTGMNDFLMRDFLTDDVSANYPGWNWQLPSDGRFRCFPRDDHISRWTLQELDSALEALLEGWLTLERSVPTEQSLSEGLKDNSASSNPTSSDAIWDMEEDVGHDLGDQASPGFSSTDLAQQHAWPKPSTAALEIGEGDVYAQNKCTLEARSILMLQELLKRSDQQQLVSKEATQEDWQSANAMARLHEVEELLRISKEREAQLNSIAARHTARIAELEALNNEELTKVPSRNDEDLDLKRGAEWIVAKLGKTKASNETLRSNLEIAEERLKRMCESLQQSEATIQAQLETIRQRNTTIGKKDGYIRDVEKSLAQKERIIREKDETIRNKENVIRQKEDEIMRKEEIIRQTEGTVNLQMGLNRNHGEQARECELLREQVQILEGQLSENIIDAQASQEALVVPFQSSSRSNAYQTHISSPLATPQMIQATSIFCMPSSPLQPHILPRMGQDVSLGASGALLAPREPRTMSASRRARETAIPQSLLASPVVSRSGENIASTLSSARQISQQTEESLNGECRQAQVSPAPFLRAFVLSSSKRRRDSQNEGQNPKRIKAEKVEPED